MFKTKLFWPQKFGRAQKIWGHSFECHPVGLAKDSINCAKYRSFELTILRQPRLSSGQLKAAE